MGGVGVEVRGGRVKHIQHGAANDRGILGDTPVLPSENEGEDDGVEKVSEGSVEGPEGLEAAGMLAVEVKAGGGAGDFGRESGESFFKGCWGGVLGLGRVSGWWLGCGRMVGDRDLP